MTHEFVHSDRIVYAMKEWISHDDFLFLFFLGVTECIKLVAYKPWSSGCLFDVVIYYRLCTCDTVIRMFVLR